MSPRWYAQLDRRLACARAAVAAVAGKIGGVAVGEQHGDLALRAESAGRYTAHPGRRAAQGGLADGEGDLLARAASARPTVRPSCASCEAAYAALSGCAS